MQPGFNIPFDKLVSKRFRIKKVHFNTYEIDGPMVKGQLRLLAIPTNLYEVPQKFIPKTGLESNLPSYVVGSQVVVSFTNSSTDKTLKPVPQQTNISLLPRDDISSYILDQPNEPWNEYIVQGNPPILVKVRAILTKLEKVREYTDVFGDPILSTNQDISNSVSIPPTGEGGLS